MVAVSVAVAVVATAFAVGGGGSKASSHGLTGQALTTASAPGLPPTALHGAVKTAPSFQGSNGGGASGGEGSSVSTGTSGSVGTAGTVPDLAPAVAAPQNALAANGAASSASGGVESIADGVTATRVVKTGNLDLQVPRGQVQATVTKLVNLTTGLNGYVSESRTDNIAGSPNGEVTVRIPVGSFDNAVSSAEALGHVTSLTTNAHDVTGKYVDLGARLTALQKSRSTYLTILGHATTIGATLAVQDRIDGVQQQIEELQGQLHVLRNQSADGTLTIDVSQVGSVLTPVKHHTQSGIGKAWHRSISRFNRGIDAIIGALGPLLLAILILAVIVGVARFGYRGARRATS
jgi:Domain of unknown function (DUF4349)